MHNNIYKNTRKKANLLTKYQPAFRFSLSACINRITSTRRFSTAASCSSRSRRRASRPENHSSRARSSSSGLACASIHEFMASRWSRQTHVVVKVRLRAHSAKAGGGKKPVSKKFCHKREKKGMVFTSDFLGAVASYPFVVHLFDLLFLCCG